MIDTTRPFTVAAFNQYLSEKKLMASRCTRCGELSLPPRAICPKCYSGALEWMETSGKGKLSGFTSIYIAPTFMVEQGFNRENPYVSGIVELDEGVKISARILGVDPKKPEEIKVGTPVSAAFIETGEGEARKTYLAFEAS
ncbi:MAG: Zn-ribbon domain-containing OB-fold protein [Chloroflexi bacterium]|nr:MAG: Zn-ribbon domain-containing OB-fold protein [Chloroflexota bacterium]